jgi:hypothetical protein
MARIKNQDAKVQDIPIGSRNPDGKVNEIQMARLMKSRWQGSRNPDGKAQEIQMARFKNPDGKVQEMQMARLKKPTNTVGRDQEKQLPRFNKSLWQGSRNTTGELPVCLPA